MSWPPPSPQPIGSKEGVREIPHWAGEGYPPPLGQEGEDLPDGAHVAAGQDSVGLHEGADARPPPGSAPDGEAFPLEGPEEGRGVGSDGLAEPPGDGERIVGPGEGGHGIDGAWPGIDLLALVADEDLLGRLPQQDVQHGRIGILGLVQHDEVVVQAGRPQLEALQVDIVGHRPGVPLIVGARHLLPDVPHQLDQGLGQRPELRLDEGQLQQLG